MASYEDWWGFLVFVFFILALAMFVIKILIEYPGLLELRLFNSDSSENLVEEVERHDDDIELNNVARKVTKERDKEPKCYENSQIEIQEEETLLENISEDILKNPESTGLLVKF
jgi:flagellar biosynthesis/type III secretory pathway M-ring protein FliF/YscJ